MVKVIFKPSQIKRESTYILLNHAGGLASNCLLWWQNLGIEGNIVIVEYPGRGLAAKETIIKDYKRLLYDIIEILLPYITKNTVIIGKSLGGYLAYDVCAFLFSKCNLILNKLVMMSVGSATDIKTLHSDNNIDAEVRAIYYSEEQSHFRDFILNDIDILKTYHNSPSLLYNIPTVLIRGKEDLFGNNDEITGYWNSLTMNNMKLYLCSGGHLFYTEKENFELIKSLISVIE